MTSDFFMECFETPFIPSLSGIGECDSSPKTMIDELCIAHKQLLLPLPPYAPELNPIEKTEANLKQSITELLRVSQSVMDCLIYYFKTK